MRPSDAEAAAVRLRAAFRCEYCLLPSIVGASAFQIDHVIANQHRGPTRLANLAWACKQCNQHKGTNIAGIERVGRAIKTVRLFNPRSQKWSVHFRFEGSKIVGRSAIGRVTVDLLNMNESVRVEFREALFAEGWDPFG